MENNNIPIDILQCPYTREPLTLSNNKLKSSGYHYNWKKTYWDFFPEKDLNFLTEKKWKIWEVLQANGQVSYENDPEGNLGVGNLKEYIDFANFCSYRGRVLDIGVGPQKIPSHFDGFLKEGVTFFGIDPLEGSQPRDFIFCKCLGEYLPFRDKTFDQIIFATSLDHFLEPQVALLEAKRVLKDEGEIIVLMGEKILSPNKTKVVVTNAWYEKLKVPKGADDRFHYRKFDLKEFEKFVQNTNLKIYEMVRQPVRDWSDKIEDFINPSDPIWGDSLFYKLKKV